MAFEQFKTQVLLLHSQQGTLDNLSAGFNDNYSVHCATTGSEALNTLGETPIHVIVSAQELPGMSGLEALREAKKRSPDTIGILLAGADKSDGLEALVGAKEVFQIVREKVTAESLLHLVESATQQARLLALAESANDNAANPDMPVTEEIVMETSENGSLIISDGTNRLPALKPQKIQLSPDTGARQVDLLVMTRDDEFLATISDSARGLHHLHHALTPAEAEKFVHDKKVGVLITDAAMVGSEVEALTDKLRKEKPRMVAIVAGRRDDGEMLMDLINRGHVYRFLLKPVSPGRARLAIEASVKHHIEAPDSAFKPKAPGKSPTKPLSRFVPKPKPKPKPKPAASVPSAPPQKTKPKAPEEDASIPVLTPESKAKPKISPAVPPQPAAKATAQKPAGPATQSAAPAPIQSAPPVKPVTRPQAKPAPPPKAPGKDKGRQRIEPTISAPRATEPLYDASNTKRKIRATMTGIAASVDRTLTSAGSLATGAQDAVAAHGEAVAGAVGSALKPLHKPKTLKIAGASIAACAVALLAYSNRDSLLSLIVQLDTETVAVDAAGPGTDAAPVISAPQVEVTPAAEAELSPYEALLAEARAATEAGNYTKPEGFNAFDLYLDLVKMTPDDPVVAEELDIVIGRVLGLAEAAIIDDDIADASATLARVRKVDPDNPRLALLEVQLGQAKIRAIVDEARLAIRDERFDDADRLISEARNMAGGVSANIDLVSQELSAARLRQKVEEALDVAGQHLDAGNLVAPSNNNARYYYELALTNDPGNQAAQGGLKAVAAQLALKARDAIDAGRLEDATRLLSDARALDPAGSELAASNNALDAAVAAKAEAERRAEAARLAEIERQAELARQAEAAKLAELERQAEVARQAEVERQAQLRKQAELDQQAEETRLAELRRQEEEARQAEIRRQEGEVRQAKIREEQQRNAEKVAAATATTSALGVAGSKVRETAGNSSPRPAAARNVSTQSAPRIANAAPPPASAVAEGTPAELPTITLPMTAAVTDGARTFGMENGGATHASMSAPQGTGNTTSGGASTTTVAGSATPTSVPINSLTRTNYVAPEYPRSAQRRNLSGSVDLTFTVTTIGTVTDVRVTGADPEGVFDDAAMDAVSKWRFDPVIENGVALEKTTAVRLSFNLD